MIYNETLVNKTLANVSFQPDFCAKLAKELVNIPNRTATSFEGYVSIDTILYSFFIETDLLFSLSETHQASISGTLPDDIQVLLKTTRPSSKALVLLKEDIESLFFVIDKILAGAESVTLDGKIQVYDIIQTGLESTLNNDYLEPEFLFEEC